MTRTDDGKEREAFESAMRLRFPRLRIEEGYTSASGTATSLLWEGWQLARSHQQDSLPVWVACSERMPEKWTEVLVYPFRDDGITSLLAKRKDDADYAWMRFDRDGYLYPVNVTHWMPLPSPPEPPKE